MKVEREKALEHKKRMSRMMEDKENFLSKITAARSFIYEVGPLSPPHQLKLSVDRWSSVFMLTVLSLKEKLKAFQERLVEERKKRLEERKKQRKEDRRNAYYRQKEEEAQRIHEEQLKKGNKCALGHRSFHDERGAGSHVPQKTDIYNQQGNGGNCGGKCWRWFE